MVNALWRVDNRGLIQWARGPVASGPLELLDVDVTLSWILSEDGAGLDALESLPSAGSVPTPHRILAPIDRQEVWAAGVTYQRSRDGRRAESAVPDHYDRIYEADRPELFFKATAERVRGPTEPVAIRADSGWDVPEPELGVVIDARGSVCAFVGGNDMSSRHLEGTNPLYLPQAKIYSGSCAIGPCLVPVSDAPAMSAMMISLSVVRAGTSVYQDQAPVADLRYTPEELANWLFRGLEFPLGVFLLTGTGIVPPPEFTLEPGDQVNVEISGLGSLSNPVEIVGQRLTPTRSLASTDHHGKGKPMTPT